MVLVTDNLHLGLINVALSLTIFVLLIDVVLGPLWSASISTPLTNKNLQLLVNHKGQLFTGDGSESERRRK